MALTRAFSVKHVSLNAWPEATNPTIIPAVEKQTGRQAKAPAPRAPFLID